MSTGKK